MKKTFFGILAVVSLLGVGELCRAGYNPQPCINACHGDPVCICRCNGNGADCAVPQNPKPESH